MLHYLKNRLKEIFSILIFSLFFISAQGQGNYILYGFRDVQQGNYLNPAFTSKAKIVIGFPGLSNLDVSYFNTAGTFSDIVTTQNGNDSLKLDLSKVISQAHPVDHVNVSVNQDLLYVGVRVGQSFLSFGVKQRFLFRAFLPNDFFKLVWNGNSPYVGPPLDLKATIVNEDHFIDYHLGASIPVSKAVTVGLRVHILQGFSNIHTVNNLLQVTTLNSSQQNFDIVASTDVEVNTAGLPDSTGFDAGTYLNSFKNLGFTFDLGIDFEVTKQLKFSASLLDFGSISFKENTKTYKSKVDNLHFNSDQIDFANNDDPAKAIGDTLKEIFNISDFSQNYKSKLPVRVMFGGEYYSKDQRNRASILFSGRFYPGYFEPAVSLAFDRTISKHFSFKVSYTYIKYDPINVGLAFALNVKPFQFYMYTDNILGVSWDKQRLVQVGFGLNIRIPDKKKLKTDSSND